MDTYSFLIINFILLVIMFLIISVSFVLIFKNLGEKKKAGRAYTPFYIENGELTINNLLSTKFLLSDISHVELCIFKPVSGQYRSSGHSAYIRIVKTDGKKSIKFLFDSSIYTKKYNFFPSDSDLLESLKMVENELKAASIQYTVQGKEKLE